MLLNSPALLGAMHMLDWIKRITTAVPSERLAQSDNPASQIGKQIEHLMGRLEPVSWRPDAGSGGAAQPRIIVVASQKGGVGKTTIAAHLAVHASVSGQGPVALIDTDPQGSLGEWWDARNEEHAQNGHLPALARVKLDSLATKLAEFRSNGVALVIIDTPPALTASIQQAIEIADLVLIPARPSPHDLRAIGATVHMTRKAAKPFFFVVNGAAPRANITAEAVAALSDHGRVAPVILYQRTDFAASMIDGQTVMETTVNGRSAQEIAQLWKYTYGQMSLPAAA